MMPSPEVVRAAFSNLSEARVTAEFGNSSARNLAVEYEQTIQDAANFPAITNVAPSSTFSPVNIDTSWGPIAQHSWDQHIQGEMYATRLNLDSHVFGKRQCGILIVHSGTAQALFQELGKAKRKALFSLVTYGYQARERAFCVTDQGFRFIEANTEPVVTPGKEVEFPWLYKTYLLVEEGLQAQALKALYWGIEDLLAGRQFASLNRVFAQVDLLKLSPEVMIGLIRSTFRARLAISAWLTLLKRIDKELERRAIPNWKNLLVGLTL